MTLGYQQKHNKLMSVDLEPLHCYLQLTEEYLENCNMEEAENHCFAASNKEAAKPLRVQHLTNITQSTGLIFWSHSTLKCKA